MSGARLARWLGVPRPVGAPPPADLRAAVRRRRFEEAGELLFAHDLEPGDRNYALARAYLAGEAPAAGGVAALLRAEGRLTEAAMTALAEELAPPDPCGGEALAAFAERLAEQVGACLGAAARFAPSARALGAALDRDRAGADPAATLDRLAALTRELADAARLADEELGRARDEVESLRASLDDARRAAVRDHLTGLPNRRGFEEALAARGGTPGGCVALCDLDRFKQINDDHGHDAGDRVLRYFAERLRDALDGRATVARYGGEEFVCLFADAGPADALAVLDGFRAELGARSLVNRTTGAAMPPLTFSAGLAGLGGEAGTVVARADGALYAAKRGGRDRLVIADA